MRRRHVPDLLLLSPARTVTVVDVKPAELAGDPGVAAVFAWMDRLCRARACEVWSGEEAVRLANVRFLAGARRPDPEVDALVDRLDLTLQPGETWGDVVLRSQEAHGLALAEAAVRTLLWRGRWTTDLTSSLSRSSVLSCAAAA